MLFFHGTSLENARQIRQSGFRRGSTPTYTGTGINLTPLAVLAYEYGTYEAKGCILTVEVEASARTASVDTYCLSDSFWRDHPQVDAVSLCGGNVWVVWNTSVLKVTSQLSHDEALARLVSEFEEDGPNCAYNGLVGDYAEVYWKRPLTQCSASNYDRMAGRLAEAARRWPQLSSPLGAAAAPGLMIGRGEESCHG